MLDQIADNKGRQYLSPYRKYVLGGTLPRSIYSLLYPSKFANNLLGAPQKSL